MNLAIEEYLFKNTKDDYFMLWQNDPTVVIGSNQNLFAEINTEYTEKNNILISRRITGGGAVYHDHGNLNYSFISNSDSSNINFESFCRPIIDALFALGINAELSGRNDLTVDGKKISGNAQAHFNNRVLHHGTLLFNSNLEVLSQALKVDEEKIKSKAIKSTRSRVANIKPLLPIDIDIQGFANFIRKHIIETFSATETDVELNDHIRFLAKRNSSDEWLTQKSRFVSLYDFYIKQRYDFGTVIISMKMNNDFVEDIKIEGDFFGKRSISELELQLKKLSISELIKKIENVNINEYIFGMSESEFISLIKKNPST